MKNRVHTDAMKAVRARQADNLLVIAGGVLYAGYNYVQGSGPISTRT